MTKYLFLLGFCLFSISFLSTPAANAIQIVAYKGVVYDSEDFAILACNKRGRDLLRNMRTNNEPVDKQSPPAGCDKEKISQFVLFEELHESYSVGVISM